ncbi:MAG: ABC transporter permease subunit [Polyangiales bacterium]
MLARVYAVALTAFRESLRDRILFAVLGLGAASVFFGLGIGSISYAESVRVLVDHGLVTASLLGNLVAIFLGANFLYKELELRTLYVLLAKPLGRHELVLGKYLGILVTCAVFVCLTCALLLGLVTMVAAEESWAGAQRAQVALGPAVRLLHSRGWRAAALAALVTAPTLLLLSARLRRKVTLSLLLPASAVLLAAVSSVAGVVAPDETGFVLWSALLVMAEVSLTAAFSMLFSSFSTPFVTGMLSVGVFAIGRSTWLMSHLPRSGLSTVLRGLLSAFATVVPNLHLFVPARAALGVGDLAASAAPYVAQSALYALAWVVVMLTAASLLFRRRDLV